MRAAALFASTISLSLAVSACSSSPSREDLESPLADVLEASRAKNLDAFRASYSAAGYALRHNRVLSEGRPRDSSIFVLPSNLRIASRFCGVTSRGDTASLISSHGRIGPSAPLKIECKDFVREEGRWKFHGSRTINAPEGTEEKIIKGDAEILAEHFPPPGNIPKAQPLIDPPDYLARQKFVSYGLRLRVVVNGLESELSPSAVSGFSWLLGGLRRGENIVELHAEPVEHRDPRTGKIYPTVLHFEVTAQDVKGRGKRVIDHKTRAPASVETFRFELSDKSFEPEEKPI